MKPDFASVWVAAGMFLAFAGVAWLATGNSALAGLFGLASLPVAALVDHCRQQARRIAELERRVLIVEEEKASGEWVANIDRRRERDREFFERQVQGLYEPSRSA